VKSNGASSPAFALAFQVYNKVKFTLFWKLLANMWNCISYENRRYFSLCLTQIAHRVTCYHCYYDTEVALLIDVSRCYSFPVTSAHRSVENFGVTMKAKVLVLSTRTNSFSGVILEVVSYTHCFALIYQIVLHPSIL
jgi:hypothetical protein